MPGHAIDHPLSVRFVLPAETQAYCRRLDDLPNQRLAADLTAGLAAATHPHGPIRTRSVASQYVSTVRRMVRELTDDGFSGGLADLTSAELVRYWLTCDYHRESRIRAVLRAFHAAVGRLDPVIVRHLEGRRIHRASKGKPNPPYTEGEWQRLADACGTLIRTSFADHQAAVEAAARGADPRSAGMSDENLAWLLARAGPVTARALEVELGAAPPLDDHARVLRSLFPDGNTAFAYNTLFAMRTGIVPDGIDSLTVSSLKRTSPATMIASYRKGRRGGEALNLPRDAVRLLDQWMEHSALLRQHAGGLSERLWLHIGSQRSWAGRAARIIFADARSQARRRSWMLTAGVDGDDGQPLAVHGGRVRATYQQRRDRANWTGRTTIDPNHSARVEGDHYLSSHTPAQLEAIDGIIEQAQGDLRRKALPPVVVTADDAADFAGAFPRLVEEAGLDSAAIDRLLSGEQDVFVASCANPLNSPHAPAGVICPARPWVCLLCPLAAFSSRHLPNLLRLKEYFAEQSRRMTAAEFMQVFGPYSSRLDDDILPRFPETAMTAAAAHRDTFAGGVVLDLEEVAL